MFTVFRCWVQSESSPRVNTKIHGRTVSAVSVSPLFAHGSPRLQILTRVLGIMAASRFV